MDQGSKLSIFRSKRRQWQNITIPFFHSNFQNLKSLTQFRRFSSIQNALTCAKFSPFQKCIWLKKARFFFYFWKIKMHLNTSFCSPFRFFVVKTSDQILRVFLMLSEIFSDSISNDFQHLKSKFVTEVRALVFSGAQDAKRRKNSAGFQHALMLDWNVWFLQNVLGKYHSADCFIFLQISSKCSHKKCISTDSSIYFLIRKVLSCFIWDILNETYLILNNE